jgi:alpha-D-ribose 1-methylphosphonate 5-triphosphate synthase subunit PhnH
LRTVLATLLDEQASLAVYGADAPGWAEEIGDITGVRLTTVETADYWLCSGVPPVEMLAALKQGSLLAPEEGATALVWLGSPIPGQAGRARISGPGVASTACLAVSSPLLQTIEHRLAVPFEYPMGFDLFIVDSEGRVLGLPRTSNVDLFMDGEG